MKFKAKVKRRKVWVTGRFNAGTKLMSTRREALKFNPDFPTVQLIEHIKGDVIIGKGEYHSRTANAIADWLESICNQPQFHTVLDAERMSLARSIREMAFATSNKDVMASNGLKATYTIYSTLLDLLEQLSDNVEGHNLRGLHKEVAVRQSISEARAIIAKMRGGR